MSSLIEFKSENFKSKTDYSNNTTEQQSHKQDKYKDSIDLVLEFPATCFAPDSDPEIVKEYYNYKYAKANSLGLTQEDLLNKFNISNRWTTTALDGGGLAQGDVTTLTWSYVPDGTPIGNGGCGVSGESTDDSNLISFFNNIYGSPTTPGDYTTAPWHQIFINMFDSWSDVSGLVFVYEPNDDGVTVVTGGAGTSGVRGDFRISGHALDGNSGVLACNYFPNNGDMIIDTSDNYFSNNPGIGTTNVLTHEIGHGLGIAHVCPVNETKLMEPFVTTAFQGPQEDDILATNRSYGDPDGDNDTSVNATFLGSDPNPVTYIKQLRSIDDDTELDYYSFTISEISTLTATLTPTGTTYLDGVQFSNGACSAGTNFNALTISDLMLEILNTDGTSVLATANSNGPGDAENLLATIAAPGTYFVRVQQQGAAVDNVQMYDLDLSIEAGACVTANIPTNIQATAITDSSAQISWDAQSSVLYDLRYRESGTTPWIDVTDLVSSSTTLTGLTELTKYEAQVRSKCPGDTPTAYSSSIFFTTIEFVLEYCDAGPTSNVDSEIESVVLNGETTSINNNTTNICTGSTGGEISDFTNLSADLIPGSNYILSVEFGDCDDNVQYDGAGGVWIDWNLDGDFQDANEEIGTADVAVSAGNVIEDFTINVPPTQSSGSYRMRIVQEEGTTSAGVSPCGTFTWGAVEDYTINILENPCTVFEDFEAGLPTGWSTVINTGTCDWANQSATPIGDDFPTLAMVFDDDACGNGAPASNVSLLSDVYDTTGASSILIGYDVAFQEFSGETFTVEVFDGAAWQQIALYNTDLNPDIQTEADIDATAFANPNFQVRWTYDDAGGVFGWYAGVDNFCMKLAFNEWQGTISTDWSTPVNWSSGTVPTSTDVAVIQDVPNQPLIDGSTIAAVDNLILNPNTVVSVEGVLNVLGDITNDGDIIFKSSDLLGSGQFDEFTGTITGTGEVTVERYIPAQRAFRFLSSPVTTTDFIYENWQESGSTPLTEDNLGTHITGGDSSLGFDQSGSNNPSMYTFNNATQIWEPLDNTNATKLNAGEAYLTMVRGDRTINLMINSNNNIETTLRSTGDLFTGVSTPTLSTGLGAYSLIANPYQAVVDYSLASRTDLTDFIYVWDASIGGTNGRGGYVTVEVSSNSITDPDPTSSDATKFIAPGMSFFVQNPSSGPISPSLTFNENDKATGVNQVTVFNTYPNFYINSRLYLSSDYQNGHSERDAIGLRFSDNFTSLASDEDATKLGNPDENYAVVNNGLRSIDKQAVPSLGHEIDFSITNYTETNYSLTFVMENKPEDLGVFLKDEYLGTQTELTESFVYDFSVDQNISESIVESRFSLIFDNTTLGVNESTFGDNFSLYPNPTSDGIFSIKTPNLSGEVNIEITNLLGQQVYKQELSVESQQVNVNAENLSTGVYIVEMLHGKKTFVSKLIVK